MLMVYGTARVAEKDRQKLIAAARDMVAASRAEDGCLDYAYGFDLFEPTLMRIIERWADADALQAHFATQHMAAWRAALGMMDIRDVELFTLNGEAKLLSL